MHSECDIIFLHLSLNFILMLSPQYQQNKTTPNNKESVNKKYKSLAPHNQFKVKTVSQSLLLNIHFSIRIYGSNILFQIHIVLCSACSDDKLARM